METSGKSSGKCKKIKTSPISSEKPDFPAENSKEPLTLPDFNLSQTKIDDKSAKNFSPNQNKTANENDIYDINQIGNEVELKPNLAGKLPLPRLPSLKLKPQNITPPKSLMAKGKARNSQKYKNIQPKLISKCDNADLQGPLSKTKAGIY